MTEPNIAYSYEVIEDTASKSELELLQEAIKRGTHEEGSQILRPKKRRQSYGG
jgi:hypothetical protein